MATNPRLPNCREFWTVFLTATVIILSAFLGIQFAQQKSSVMFLDNLHWTTAYTAAAWLAWIGVRTATGIERTTRRWFAIGLSAYSFGQFLWDIQVATGWNPFPGPSDFFYLWLGPCYAAGFIATLRAQAQSRLRTVALDACALSVVALVLTLALYLPRRGDTELWPLIVLVLYPVVLLTAACIGLIMVPTLRLKAKASWLISLAALILNGGLWMEWNSRTLDNALADGTLLNKIFSVAAIGAGVGAAFWKTPATTRPEWERRYEGILRLLPLLVVIGAAISVVVVWTLPGVPAIVRIATGLGSAAVVMLAFGRQSLLLTERDELLAAQRAARDNEVNFKTLFETAQDAIILLGPKGCVDCNPSALKMFGVEKEQVIGRTPADLSPKFQSDGQLSEQKAKSYDAAALEGQPQLFDWHCMRSDGTVFDVEVRLNRVERHGEFIIQAVVRDITTRRKLEEQLRQSQKMEAIGQLSGGIAHDFNNLLTAINGNISLLSMSGGTPAEQKEYIDEILLATERASDLTRQLLLFSRKQVMRFRELNLNDSVKHTTKMLRRLVGEDITLRTEFAPTLPDIRADASMIDQIIINLAVNARDAMPGGGSLLIRTSFEKIPPPGESSGETRPHVCLTFTDTGCGIAAGDLPHIFEPFFTTKEVGKGTGLGLATIYGIVKEHNGWVTVESEVGKGTTFKIHLPALENSVATPHQEAPATEIPLGRETILVVEDEFAVRKTIRQILTRLGYQTLEAENGAAALKIWEQQKDRIALVLTDIIMPNGMKGYDLAARLNAENPGVKIVYISGYTGSATAHQTELIEGANFIRKPFSVSGLAEILRRNLDGKV